MVGSHKYIWIALCLAMVGCTSPESANNNQQRPKESSERVDSIMSKLTLAEKVGQMTQLTLDMVCVGQPYALEEPHRIDADKLEKVIVDMNVGSILNCGGHSYNREFWLETIKTIQEASQRSSSQLPVLYGIDAIHGVTYTDSSTLFPQQIGLAATWDTSLVKDLAVMSAYETRASGIRWNFSPVLDIARDPRWPRFWESFGEDVKLVTDMGEAMVSGYQGDEIGEEHVSACLKHFLGYSQTLTGKDRTQAWIPERQLRELFLPQFQNAIDAGAKTIMVNSGEINGIPVHINPIILTELLRNELGFEGMVVTDWEDIKYLVTRHKVAKDYKEAIAMSINAGIDMSMVPTDLDFTVLLKELVEEGKVPESRINESVRRILELKEYLGLFDSETPSIADYPRFAADEHRAMARKAAQESIVMLRNNDALPMEASARILVVGEMAKSLNVLNGGWTRTWQGADPQYNTPGMPSIYEALEERGIGADYLSIQDYLKRGKMGGYDMILAVIGEYPYTETPGDIEHLDLPADQLAVLAKLGEESIPTTLTLVEGRPRTFGDLPEGIDAFFLAMLPGDQGGRAIVDLLLGDANPSGHLPFTYPRYASAHTTYDHKYTDMIDTDFSMNAVDPLFEFGEGLSYGNMEFSGLELSADTLGMNEVLNVSVIAKNTGSSQIEDVVKVFVSDSVASITPSVKRLRAYKRISVGAGKEEKVSFSIPVKELAFVGVDLDWIVEEGTFGVEVEGLTDKFEVK